ncbi:MAG: hypothetical protein H6729_07845 [Deltaproteobacteria bacterium]|nr:hypothetical protein [Deltaproteobacteria bacterium]
MAEFSGHGPMIAAPGNEVPVGERREMFRLSSIPSDPNSRGGTERDGYGALDPFEAVKMARDWNRAQPNRRAHAVE